jgi:hypothetical protein
MTKCKQLASHQDFLNRQVGSAAPINARAYQVRMTSRAVNFMAIPCSWYFFPWFLDTLSGLGIFDLRFSSMNCCNSVVSIISVTPVISGLLPFYASLPFRLALLFLLVALIPTRDTRRTM